MLCNWLFLRIKISINNDNNNDDYVFKLKFMNSNFHDSHNEFHNQTNMSISGSSYLMNGTTCF